MATVRARVSSERLATTMERNCVLELAAAPFFICPAHSLILIGRRELGGIPKVVFTTKGVCLGGGAGRRFVGKEIFLYIF